MIKLMLSFRHAPLLQFDVNERPASGKTALEWLDQSSLVVPTALRETKKALLRDAIRADREAVEMADRGPDDLTSQLCAATLT